MNARNGRRLERAVIELLRSIAQLRDDQSFYVIVFGWATRRMFDDDSDIPEMLPATLGNKRRLRQWLAEVQTISGTDPRRSLQLALEMEPSAVFLLSDGSFNQPTTSRYLESRGPEVIDVVIETNPGNVPVHTIAFEDRGSEKAMQNIAGVSGGEHRFVAEPRDLKGSRRAPRTRRATRDRVSPSYRHTVLSFPLGD